MSTWTLAFVVTPAVVVALAYLGVLLHERDLRKRRGIKPGE